MGLIPKNRTAILSHVLKTVSQNGERVVSASDFFTVYNRFLAEHDLTDSEAFEIKTVRSLVLLLQRRDFAMVPRWSSIRYYEWGTKNFSLLEDIFQEMVSRNIECSTLLVLDEYREELEELDIRDEYELHWAARKILGDSQAGIEFGRMPMVTFGDGSRDMQIMELMKEMAPVSVDDFANEYARRYGVRADSFAASFLAPYRQYRSGDGYDIPRESLKQNERDWLEEELADIDYISTEFVRERFQGSFPGASRLAISDAALRPLGFEISETLIVRSGMDLRGRFSRLLDSFERFDGCDEGFGDAVLKHSQFVAELNIRLRSFALVEYKKNEFVSSRYLSEHFGVGSDDLEAYLHEVFDTIPEDQPFTIKSLGRLELSHRVDAVRASGEFGDEFFTGILSAGAGSIRFSTTSMNDVTVFCKTRRKFDSLYLVRWIVKREGSIYFEDLIDLFEQEYGIATYPAYLRQLIDRASLFFYEDQDLVFLSQEAFHGYVRRILGQPSQSVQ